VTTAIGFQALDSRILSSEAGETHRGFFVCLRDAPVNPSVVRRDKALHARSREDEMPVDFDATSRQCWKMAQRVGIQIAELPSKTREVAFAGTERCLRAAASELGVAGQQLDSIVDIQMRAIRQIVTDIDIIGSPQGGKA
jgi:hypothetical protein